MYVTTNESNICEALYLQELTLAELTKEVSRALDLTVRQWSYFLCIKAYINYDRQTESQQSFITIFYLLHLNKIIIRPKVLDKIIDKIK
jgi:hypothetical protein